MKNKKKIIFKKNVSVNLLQMVKGTLSGPRMETSYHNILRIYQVFVFITLNNYLAVGK